MKKNVLFLVLFLPLLANAQLTGTKNIPGDYASLDAAVTDLNTSGVGAGGVTLNLIAGNAQTAPVGGYAITTLTGSAANPIIIQGNGNDVTANAGLTVGSINDAIFKIIGGDYITITGFTMQENAANTTTAVASNNMTEFGVALFYTSATDGAQHNVIKNNIISLNRSYANTFGVYSNVRHTATDMTTTADITALTGSNSNNRVYGNTISNVNAAVVFIGSGTAAYMDAGNVVGGPTTATYGNTITNWGGAAAASAYVSNSATSYCIYMNHQTADSVASNTLTSATFSSAISFRGILKDYTVVSPSGTFTSVIYNNTITMTSINGGSTTVAINTQGFSTTAVSGYTLNITNNTILNCALAGGFVTINNASSLVPGVLNISYNIIRGTTISASSNFIAIQNAAVAVSTSININNNQIGNASGNAFTYSVASTGAVTGITTFGSAPVISVSNNDFRGFVHSVTSSGSQTYISYRNSGSGTVTVNNNTFTNLSVATSGNVTFLLRSNFTMLAGGTENVSNNSIVGTFTKTVAGGTVAFKTTTNATDPTGTFVNETGNNFSNITVTGATTINGWNNTSGASNVSGPTKTFSNNTFSNITGGSNATTVVQFSNGGGSTSISTNTISSVSGGGDVTGISIYTAAHANNTVTVSANTLTTISSSGTASTVSGISVSAGTDVTLSGNTLTSITSSGATTPTLNGVSITGGTTVNVNTNTINSISTSAGTSPTLTGINLTGGTTTHTRDNIISGISSAGTTSPLVRGITISAATTGNIYRNKIYDLSVSAAVATTSPAVNGILQSGGTTVNTYNNLIGDLRASTADLTDAIRGISVTSSTATTTHNVSFNTVYLNASSTGTNFGTTGIYHTTSGTSTTAALRLRNNLVYNLSTANGTGLTVAYRRSSTTLTNYGSVSDRNLFYAGTASATNLIFYDGTNSDQTLAAYKTRVSTRDANSVSGDITFLSTTGSNSNFLHVNPSIANEAESAGINITGITDDFDATIRQGNTGYAGTGTAPDIGADELETNVPLPIELLSFSVRYTCDFVTAAWATASEINTDFFTLEVSYDAIHFTPVSFVKGGGNSSQILHYTTSDASSITLFNKYKTMYYRLKQTDFDGTYDYSSMQSLTKKTCKDDAETELQVLNNPIAQHSDIGVRLKGIENETAELSLIDMHGKKILSKNIKTHSHWDVIQLDNHSLFVRGLYLITIKTRHKNLCKRLVIH